MVRRVISTIMVFLLSVIKGSAWLGLHLLLAVLEILKIIFLISCDILKVMLLILAVDEWRGGDNHDEDDQNDSLYRSCNRKTAD